MSAEQPRPALKLELLVPRIDGRALGCAVGLTSGAAALLFTAFHAISGPQGVPLYLVSQYFSGYSVTWTGALIGALWAAAIGFAVGWLLAIVYNATIAVWVFILRSRADLSLKRNVIDQIR